jgi:Sigma-70, region 4
VSASAPPSQHRHLDGQGLLPAAPQSACRTGSNRRRPTRSSRSKTPTVSLHCSRTCPPRRREVLELRYIDELDFDEIAERVGMMQMLYRPADALPMEGRCARRAGPGVRRDPDEIDWLFDAERGEGDV